MVKKLPLSGSHIPKPGDGKRSNRWPKARRDWLRIHDTCAACGGKRKLQVHHKRPFHFRPELELAEANFITLCEQPTRDCHYRIGHCFDWKAANPHVEDDAALSLKRINGRKYAA